MTPRTLLSYALYHLGDWVSRPMTKWDLGWLYPLYSRLMNWSSDLDNLNKVWGPPLVNWKEEEVQAAKKSLIEQP